ncbi:MAG TPA: hypothetical protein VGO96_00430 [Pyrinomonadaceae bacterium]|nr:hypothetical protein [Pyrinomonadaceae bacterium]
MKGLSERTWKIIRKMFPVGQQENIAELLIIECGNNLPGLEKSDEIQLERFRFAALKVSSGDVDELLKAIVLAQTDWRDLLVGESFAESVTEHSKKLFENSRMTDFCLISLRD